MSFCRTLAATVLAAALLAGCQSKPATETTGQPPLTQQSLPSIGNAFGRNHATVLHAHRTVGAKMKMDSGLRQTILSLQQRLGGVVAPS